MNAVPRTRKITVVLALIGVLALSLNGWLVYRNATHAWRADVVVYGASPSGICAAVAAAREGRSVLLLEPNEHLGGMMSGGLGGTDHGIRETIGGIALEFFERCGKHYGTDISWRFEPHVAEEIFTQMLEEAGVVVRFRSPIKGFLEAHDAEIRVRVGKRWVIGRVFIDATYEGRLLPEGHFAVGREGRSVYGEPLAGVSAYSNNFAQFPPTVSGLDEQGQLLPGLESALAAEGSGDDRLPAYNFRVCITQKVENQIPFNKPVGYRAEDYWLMKRFLTAHADLPAREIFTFLKLPNGKVDLNNRAAVSTDLIGGNAKYWEEENPGPDTPIWKAHEHYTRGLLYFVSNDPSVPQGIRKEMGSWGYCKDEFVDNGNFPHQLYVREARRMIGRYVMKQADVQDKRAKESSIGMGSNYIESHHVQRFVDGDGLVRNEGFVYVQKGGRLPYDIPYESLTPKKEAASNLLVPLCLSASHVAYSSLRMEPVYMITGHAAGVAAAIAVEADIPVQDVPVKELQEKLDAQGQHMGWNSQDIFDKRRS